MAFGEASALVAQVSAPTSSLSGGSLSEAFSTDGVAVLVCCRLQGRASQSRAYGFQLTNHWPSYPRPDSKIISPASVTWTFRGDAVNVTCT